MSSEKKKASAVRKDWLSASHYLFYTESTLKKLCGYFDMETIHEKYTADA